MGSETIKTNRPIDDKALSQELLRLAADIKKLQQEIEALKKRVLALEEA